MPKITLKAARVNANLTQAEMAEKMGVSRDSVAKWETGRAKILAIHLFKFCEVTGVSADNISLPESSTNRRQEG